MRWCFELDQDCVNYSKNLNVPSTAANRVSRCRGACFRQGFLIHPKPSNFYRNGSLALGVPTSGLRGQGSSHQASSGALLLEPVNMEPESGLSA